MDKDNITLAGDTDEDSLRIELNQVSPSFCPLRWTYLQVDIEHGLLKACCKTPFISLNEDAIQTGTSSIFNNDYFADRRQEMLAGIAHPDCDECHQQEAVGLQSYRLLQSAKKIFRTDTPFIIQPENIRSSVPRHIELIFNTHCDLRCIYCGPDFSSSWATRLMRDGSYPIPHGCCSATKAPPQFEELFWQWFTEIQDKVNYIQVNGGEPLIQPKFYEFIDRLLDNQDNTQLKLGIITNFNTPPKYLKKLERRLPQLLGRYQFCFGISQDAVGQQFEYIRNGLSWQRFDHNLRWLLAHYPDKNVQIAPTLNALNIANISELITYLARLCEEYHTDIVIRPSIVMTPGFLDPRILPPAYSHHLEEAQQLLANLDRWQEFSKRLAEIASALGNCSNLAQRRHDFWCWFDEHELRTGISVLDIFPELVPFWKTCNYRT